MAIKEFKDEYFFLSNFYPAEFTYNGITYQNSESAFQSMKTTDESVRQRFSRFSPSQAKEVGRKVELRKDWEEIKEKVMYEVCKAKFEQNKTLKQWLLNTGKEHLEEGNHWGDRIWGTCNGRGQNKLGKILMRLRNEFCKICEEN